MITPLAGARIQKKLQSDILKKISAFKVLDTVDSTNLELKRMGVADSFKLCIADAQSAGRGRQKNRWISPPASNIYLSLSKLFPDKNSVLIGLSLVIGIVCAKVLNSLIMQDKVKLKWPNDLIADNKKLGGILIDNYPTPDNDQSEIIAGIGINFAMNSEQNLDMPWVNLTEIGVKKSRNEIISRLLNELIPTLENFNSDSLRPMLDDWHELDWSKNKPVTLLQNNTTLCGVALGINDQGALLFKHNNQIHEIYSADISLRRQNAAY